MKRQFKNEEAKMYYEWQEQQRNQDLPDHYIEMLNRIKKEALSLERKEKGSKRYEAALKQLEFYKIDCYLDYGDYISDSKSFLHKLQQETCKDVNRNCLRYTLSAWQKDMGLGPEDQEWVEEEYVDSQRPHQLIDYVYDHAYQQGLISHTYEPVPDNPEETEIRVLVIGEEYYEWLRRENKEDTVENSYMFAETVSDEEAYHMLKKYNMDHTYMIYVMPIAFFCPNGLPKETNWRLSDDTKNRITRMLSSVYGNDNFYFPGVVIDYKTLMGAENHLYELAYQYFNGSSVDIHQYEVQKFEHQEQNSFKGAFAGIPFIVKYQHKTAVFNLLNVVYRFDDDGEENLLLEPTEVLFKEASEGQKGLFDEFDISVSFNEYGVIEAVHKDLTISDGTITLLTHWEYIDNFGQLPYTIEEEPNNGVVGMAMRGMCLSDKELEMFRIYANSKTSGDELNKEIIEEATDE